MSDAPALVYLEADDEIPAVVRRLRAAESAHVVVVAPGRSRATSSAVALRLLAPAAGDAGRTVSVVGDALTRSLAADAGLPAHASVDEARRAGGEGTAAADPVGATRATITVVRGTAAEETAAPLGTATAVDVANDPTLPVPVARPVRRTRAHPVHREGRRLPLIGIGALALLLLVGTVAAAALLPSARITIAVRAQPIDPVTYGVTVPDTEQRSGTVEAEATVTATGTYRIQEPSSGSVVLYNWTFFPVSVPAGTFVAAGEQAFATQADVTVPRGRLTAQGTIAAGDVEVAVVAAAPGEAANVAANAIDVVVNEGIDDQLGGVPENPEPRVLNPAPTTGGVDRSGPEITEADVEAAVRALRERLAELAHEVSAAGDDEVAIAVGDPEPTLAGVDGLAGTRDESEVTISGRLGWDVLRADAASVRRAAVEMLPERAPPVPPGHELLPGSARVEIIDAQPAGDAMEVEVRVSAASAAVVDEEAVAERVAGLAPPAVDEALAGIGDASVVLWPGWVSTVPEMTWRVDVEVVDPSPEASIPVPSERTDSDGSR